MIVQKGEDSESAPASHRNELMQQPAREDHGTAGRWSVELAVELGKAQLAAVIVAGRVQVDAEGELPVRRERVVLSR